MSDPKAEPSLYEKHNLQVDPAQTPLRLDKFLTQRLPHVSRHQLQQSIKHHLIHVNKKPSKPSYPVKPLDNIQVFVPTPPRSNEILPQHIDLSIVFEDHHLLIINKPAGLVVHPAHANWDNTLLNGLLYHLQNQPNTYPFLVHRIDKNTSGLLVIAKNEEAMCHLARQFFEHSISRNYLALVWGHPNPPTGTINLPLKRSPSDRRRICVTQEPTQGKHAITHYKTLTTYKHVTLLNCQLETGRTHQIRAHLQHIGHPLFNDPTYGGTHPQKGLLTTSYKQFLHNCHKLLPHQALHAQSLSFSHPTTNDKMQFNTPPPPAFQKVLEKWTRYT